MDPIFSKYDFLLQNLAPRHRDMALQAADTWSNEQLLDFMITMETDEPAPRPRLRVVTRNG